MPLSTPLFKSEGVINSPPPSLPAGGPTLPKYTVLFAYDTREAFKIQDQNGDRVFSDYYANQKICHPEAEAYTDNDLSSGAVLLRKARKVKVQGNPFVYCVTSSQDFGYSGLSVISNSVFNFSTGSSYGNIMNVSDVDITMDGDTMYSGRHGFYTGPFASKDSLNPGRPAADIPIIHGFTTGDTADASATYIPDGNGNPHLGHEHYTFGDSIHNALTGTVVGADISPYPDIYDVPTMGKYICSVIPFQYLPGPGKPPRDTLPKGVLVFGANLPSPDYTQEDFHQAYVTHKGDTASYITEPIHLMLNAEDTGVFYPLETDNFALTVTTSPDGLHNHTSSANPVKRSNKTGQKADELISAGLHTHTVDYYLQANIRSKKLKAYITNIENTPIANGIILAMATWPAWVDNTWKGAFIDNPKAQVLPVNWHFCDGTNGTPDLRGYNICVDMVDGSGDHDTVVESASTITVNDIHVNFEPVSHSHISPIGKITGIGTPIPLKSSHGLNNARTHSHVIKQPTSGTFTVSAANKTNVSTTQYGKTYTSIRKTNSYAFLPHRHSLAFIMYNNTIP